MNQKDQFKIIRAVFFSPTEFKRMSPAMKGLDETSNNLSISKVLKESCLKSTCLTRSSVDSSKVATAWK